MEKTFAISSAMPDLAGNGRLAIYKTLDARVSYIIIKDETFEWQNRAKQEVHRCPRCKAFIFPDEKTEHKDGVKYHAICKPLKKEKAVIEETQIVPQAETPAEAVAI